MPFHEGELLVQERTGELAQAARTGAMLSDAIIPGARPFLAQQGMLAVGSVDRDGAPRASLLFGEPGFVSTNGTSVVIDLSRAAVDRRDPLWANARIDLPLALLAIDLGSRRRLRVNGVVSALTDRSLQVAVREAYPNCPKYIQRRALHAGTVGTVEEDVVTGAALDDVRRRLVEGADTLFVASRHPERGADVSHRGGERGFVRVLDSTTVRIPDYRGNSLFNTLGNLAVEARAGLVILDFARGRALQVAGEVALHFGLPEDPRQPTGGTGRYWDLRLSGWVDLPLPRALRGTLLDASPYNPSADPGDEPSARARLSSSSTQR
jgi:predicted pyridoxine 5'-phosphate oxidase superfamily flavin-nucleotide-binding protein